MGILNILGYIGVGLGVALVLLLISYLWSRPKETVVDENNSVVGRQRGEGDWGLASFFVGFIMCIVSTLLLYNLAHFSILKSIGLGLLASIVAYFVLYFLIGIISRKNINKFFFSLAFILCTLNGAGFAVLASVWGWF